MTNSIYTLKIGEAIVEKYRTVFGRGYLVTARVDEEHWTQYLVQQEVIDEAERCRPNHDVLGFVVPWTWNMIEHEVRRIAIPAIRDAIKTWRKT